VAVAMYGAVAVGAGGLVVSSVDHTQARMLGNKLTSSMLQINGR
jgi:hypothetical protein